MLFQGEEWAAKSPFQYFVDFSEDPELARAVSEGRRREFGDFHNGVEVPDPQCEETFLRSKLNWDEVTEAEHRDMLAWYKSLIELRRGLPQLVDGRLDRVRANYNEDARWITVERDGTVLAANLGMASCTIELSSFDGAEIVLASKPHARLSGGTLRLPPQSVAVARASASRARQKMPARSAKKRKPVARSS
jgi:maltooligosyltrehalose trehalohydrolase